MKKFISATLNVLKYLGIVLFILILTGIAFEKYCRSSLEKEAFKNKTFLQIGGVNIHYLKKGSGAKTVVFASGMGSNSTIWADIQNKISALAVTISYDRSGLFLSEKRKETITNASVSNELWELLEKSNCPKPYILVAHSMAGVYLRPFINSHKKDIAAIVFMESAHPLQLKKSSKAFLASLKPPPLALVKMLTGTGIYRTIFSFTRINPEIPITHPIHKNERDFFYRSVDTLFDEVENDDANFNDASKYGDFGDIPLTIITGTSKIRTENIQDPEVRAEYMNLVSMLHHDFLNLSSRSELVEAKNSGHIVQASEPDLIVKEIKKLLLPKM